MSDQRKRLLDVRNRLLSLYRNIADELPERDVVHIRWTDAAPARMTGNDAWKAAASTAGWPLARYPKKALRPHTGYQAMGSDKQAKTAMVVAAFGRSAHELARMIREIEAGQSQSEDFNPVFFLDNPDFAAIGASGYTFEYFPKEQFCAPAARDAFQLRFRYLWRKWGAAYLLDMSEPGYLAARLDDIANLIEPVLKAKGAYSPIVRPAAPVALPPDHITLRAEYEAKSLDRRADDFALYRILGNDLPPRHRKGQTLANLRFILDHEPAFENCHKRFVLNRIIDPEAEAALIDLLKERGQAYDRIPFDLDVYGDMEWDVESFPAPGFFLRGKYFDMTPYDQLRAQAFARRHKNRYAINNNGARNFALRDGRTRAKWVLPWDGNCFLTAKAWEALTDVLRNGPRYKYVLVPMARVTENEDLLDPDIEPVASEEPQVAFRIDAEEAFDDQVHYGRRPKVEFFYRMGIEGPWSSWRDDIWDLPRPDLCADAGSAGRAGWVTRLNSGRPEQETGGNLGARARGETRLEGINALLDGLDRKHFDQHFNASELIAYDDAALQSLAAATEGGALEALRAALIRDADMALDRGPYTVTEKGRLAPSGDPHDYFHPAPYWWPNPDTSDGIPYVWRDGERIPGTRLYEPQSSDFDRTRLQRMFDDTTVLALSWSATGDLRYASHAADLLRTWFLDPATRMNPHLRYAQPRSQKPGDEGSKSGLIEMKDLYYFLDAVRLLERAGTLESSEKKAFQSWLREYLNWLQTSDQGTRERATQNNHGTCFDLQTLAIAAYLGDGDLVLSTLRTSRERLLEQFDIEGKQPHEMNRSQTAHYTAFNLQCWVNLADVADRLGNQLGLFEAADGRGLAAGFRWLFETISQGPWPFEQIEAFDRDRYLPLLHAARTRCGLEGVDPQMIRDKRAITFFPHDGIKPYWWLGSRPSRVGTSENWARLEGAIRAAETELSRQCNRLGTTHAQELPAVKDLDKHLWGGFSRRALRDLHAVVVSPDASWKDVRRAARSLARWCHLKGEFEAALALSTHMIGQADDPEVLLLQAECLSELGRAAEACALLSGAAERFPEQAADLALGLWKAGGGFRAADLRAASSAPAGTVGLPYRGAGPSSHLDQLNSFYAKAGLSAIDTMDWASGQIILKSAGDASADPDDLADLLSRAARSDSFPGPDIGPGPQIIPAVTGTGSLQPVAQVSIILPYSTANDRGGLQRLEATLANLALQSLRGLEIILVSPVGTDLPIETISSLKDQRTDICFSFVERPAVCRSGLNAGLEAAQAQAVVVAQTGTLWHPEKLERQKNRLGAGDAFAVTTTAMICSNKQEPVGAWSPAFTYTVRQNASALFPVTALREIGGWDDVESGADDLLMYRLEKAATGQVLAHVGASAPMVFLPADRAKRSHVTFPFGEKRDNFRMLARQLASRRQEFLTLPQTDAPRANVSIYGPLARRELPPDTAYLHVFVGDFSDNGLWFDRVFAHLTHALVAFEERRSSTGEAKLFAVYHAPEYVNASANLSTRIAELIDSARIVQISAFANCPADKVTLCNPYCLADMPDGLPELRPKTVDVLNAGPLTAAEKARTEFRPLARLKDVERVFNGTAVWRGLA